jgi:hypothetical protein
MRRGKAVCEALKEVRRKIAQANDINYSPNECHYEGDCAGTCAACDHGTSLAVDSTNQDTTTAQPAKTFQLSTDRNPPELREYAI